MPPIRTISGQPLAGVAVAAPIMAMQSADDMLFGMSSQSRAAVAIGSATHARRAPVSIARGPYWGADCHSQWPAEPAGAMVWAEAAAATRVAAAKAAKSIFFIVKSNLIRVFRRMRGSVRPADRRADVSSHALRARSDQVGGWFWFGKDAQAGEALRHSRDRRDANKGNRLNPSRFIGMSEGNGAAHRGNAL